MADEATDARQPSTPSPSRAERGAAAERAAAVYLEAHGLTILARNYRCKGGEIDLIAKEGATIVFVEVRLRATERFGGAGASIDGRKQQRLLRAARHFLGGHRDRACRFDAVLLGPRGIEWVRDAFGE